MNFLFLPLLLGFLSLSLTLTTPTFLLPLQLHHLHATLLDFGGHLGRIRDTLALFVQVEDLFRQRRLLYDIPGCSVVIAAVAVTIGFIQYHQRRLLYIIVTAITRVIDDTATVLLLIHTNPCL